MNLLDTNSDAEFRQRRRQAFMTAKYFRLNKNSLDLAMAALNRSIERSSALGLIDSCDAGQVFKNRLQTLRLHYSAGASLESLAPLMSDAQHAFEQWHVAEAGYSLHRKRVTGRDLRLDMSPLEFEDLTHFQLAMDMVSLGILLGDGAAIRKIAALMQSTRGTDMLFEYLLETVVPDPRDIEVFFHEEPYGLLLDAVYTADTAEQSIAFMKQYLDNWYRSFEGAPWHDGHLVQTDEYSNYEGYWAFDAAAVTVLMGLDDSSYRDHIVYPKDLADWARGHAVVSKIKFDARSGAPQRLRVPAGEPCPRAGWWSSPAAADSRRHFAQGEIMPSLGGDYGLTIWQWDERQD